MRLAASNIAWPDGADAEAAAILRAEGATGVEIAPTKCWPQPLAATSTEIAAVRAWWESRGLTVAAMQALLFGRPDLTLFAAPVARREALAYLKGVVRIAGELGVGALVFGSPKNRVKGGLSLQEADDIAVPFFRELGDAAARHGTCVCVEPNPPEYGCDWITRSAEALDLVERASSAGFRLHLDTGEAMLTGDDLPATIERAGRLLRHFHVSEPHLKAISPNGELHRLLARSLSENDYAGWVSVEMSHRQLGDDWPKALERSLAAVKEAYSPQCVVSAATCVLKETVP